MNVPTVLKLYLLVHAFTVPTFTGVPTFTDVPTFSKMYLP